MNRSKRLEPLSKLADLKHQDAARIWQQSRDELGRLQQRLAEVRAYREEYLARFHRAGNTGMSADQMKDYRVFLARLEEAVEQMEQAVAYTSKDCEQQRAVWAATRARSRALDEVIAQRRSEEVLDGLRREQRAIDDQGRRGPPHDS